MYNSYLITIANASISACPPNCIECTLNADGTSTVCTDCDEEYGRIGDLCSSIND